MRTLLFDPATGECLKEIGGAALNDIPGSVEAVRPPNLALVPTNLLRLVNGVVEQRAKTPEELDRELDAEIVKRFVRTILEDRFDVENRIRVLEGKPPITAAQFKDAVKARLGL